MDKSRLNSEMAVLVGSKTSGKRLAGNRLIIYFGGPPGNDQYGIGIDPSWRIEHGGSIIVASSDVPWGPEEGESEKDYKDKFYALCDLCQPLVGAAVKELHIDLQFGDLSIEWDNGYKLSTYMNSREYEGWYFKVRPSKMTYYVFCDKVAARGDAA